MVASRFLAAVTLDILMRAQQTSCGVNMKTRGQSQGEGGAFIHRRRPVLSAHTRPTHAAHAHLPQRGRQSRNIRRVADMEERIKEQVKDGNPAEVGCTVSESVSSRCVRRRQYSAYTRICIGCTLAPKIHVAPHLHVCMKAQSTYNVCVTYILGGGAEFLLGLLSS